MNKVTDDILNSMIKAFEDGMYCKNGISLDSKCCEDVYFTLTELKAYRDMIKVHNEKKKIQSVA